MMTHGFGKSRFESEASHMRPQLLAIALSLLPSMDDAEDAVQDTLLKLWAVRERIASTSHFHNLAVSVCRNLCLNMLRSMAVRRTDRLEEFKVNTDYTLRTPQGISEYEKEGDWTEAQSGQERADMAPQIAHAAKNAIFR